jgi:cob(I)alamin adenosyltransferase
MIEDAPRLAPQEPKELKRADSLVLINTGDGKGKSSAAFGVMGRAWARGWHVCVVQFLKSGKWRSGEHKLALELGIEWQSLGDGFTWESTDMDETEAKGRHAWEIARARIESGTYELVILDEMTYAINYGWIDIDDVIRVIQNRPRKTNLIITGRNAPEELIAIADTVTEMRVVKHAYDQGIRAMKGIEY